MSEQRTAKPHHRQATALTTVTRRLNRETDSATVSLTRDDGQHFTVVGSGESLSQRYLNALAQLPPGEYVCDAVSTPSSVYSDLNGRDRVSSESVSVRSHLPFGQYERRPVSIAPMT